jgi:hypothetical protein
MLLAAAGRAQQPAAISAPASDLAPSTAIQPAVTPTPVDITTTGGTNGNVPVFTGASTVVNSIIYQYNGGIGIGRAPAATLDVNGKSIFRGGQVLSRSGDATTSAGTISFPFIMQSSVYNSSIKGNLLPYFQLQTEPVGNNTTTTGATLNMLYYSGVGSTPSETGLYFNANGTIHFAAGQTFPASVGVTTPASLVGPAGETGPAGPPGPAGTVGPDIAVSGTIAAGRGFVSESSDPSVHGFVGTNSADNAVVVSLNATGANSYGLKAVGNTGIFAQGAQYAGQFAGDVEVTGSVSEAAGSFRIDHPLDPANKTLSHASVQSPDMMNIYNGKVVTDASGTAVVTMPSYFEALNRDFRYQLTVMGGQFAQAIVGSEIAGGAFTIKTDKPNVTVSWQVTGVRQDAWANAHRVQVEEEKADADKGYFIHPELFGHAGEASILQRNSPSPILAKQ